MGRLGAAKGFKDSVVHSGPNLANPVACAGGVDAIGEQHDEDFALGVNPKRGSRKAGVAEARGEKYWPAEEAVGAGTSHPRVRALSPIRSGVVKKRMVSR